MTPRWSTLLPLLLAACGGGSRGTLDVPATAPPVLSGCADGAGWPLGGLDGSVRAYACPGAFSAALLASRCAPGWSPCIRRPTDPYDGLGCDGLADLPGPAQVGFYASAVAGTSPAGQLPDPRLTCGAPRPGAVGTPVLFGCGPASSDAGPVRCGGFRRAVPCGVSGSPWRCDGAIVTGGDDSSGVLCCPG